MTACAAPLACHNIISCSISLLHLHVILFQVQAPYKPLHVILLQVQALAAACSLSCKFNGIVIVQVYVADKRLFSLDFIDISVDNLNIHPCDGDRPSILKGISFHASDSNMHQHG